MLNLQEVLAKFDFIARDSEPGFEYDYEAAKELIINEGPMPEFFAYSPLKPLYYINVDSSGPTNTITVSDSKVPVDGKSFESLAEAYDFVKDTLVGRVVFAGDIKAITGEDDTHFVTAPSPRAPQNFKVLLLADDELDTSKYLSKKSYLFFLLTASKYLENPKDFVLAYHFVNGHPAFWSRYNGTSTDWNLENNGFISMDVINDHKTGKPLVMLEHGAAVPPERTHHYHDLRLDSYGETYEAAIIDLAAKVNANFDLEGNDYELNH